MGDRPHSMFSDPEDQAQHEQNLEWLRLAREEPGWILSRLHHLADLEEQHENLIALRDDLTLKAYERGQENERLKEQLEAVRTAAIPVVNKLIEASNGSGLVVTKEELNALRDALASSPAKERIDPHPSEMGQIEVAPGVWADPPDGYEEDSNQDTKP